MLQLRLERNDNLRMAKVVDGLGSLGSWTMSGRNAETSREMKEKM